MPAHNRRASHARGASGRAAGRLIPRDRLAERLRRGLDAGAVTITAGAGYGKTTSLEEAVGRSAVGSQIARWLDELSTSSGESQASQPSSSSELARSHARSQLGGTSL
jgi:ATP/maltotriose-dependent transcriptional regulator MalT